MNYSCMVIDKKTSRKLKSALYKISFISIALFFAALNFPLLDWFLHSEKTWYDEYELNPDTSFLYSIYDKSGILNETLGYIDSMTYGSNWMHICYHLYNIVPCFDSHYFFACSVFFIIALFLLSKGDIKMHNEEKPRKLFAFYIISLTIVIIICIYGFFVYALQYHNTIKDIIECI